MLPLVYYKKIRVLAENSEAGNDPAYEDVIQSQDIPAMNQNEVYQFTVGQSLPILRS